MVRLFVPLVEAGLIEIKYPNNLRNNEQEPTMFASRRLRNAIATGLLGIAAGFAGVSQARAGGYDHGGYCQPSYHYVCVTVYVPKTVAYTSYVTYYDHCGQPYQVAKTCYKTIQVPVQKRVLVCDSGSPSGY
jgi:hypothetical protein